MNDKRIREIQEFADEFNNKLKSANEEYETNGIKIHRPICQTQIQCFIKSKKKKRISNSVLMESSAWKPTKTIGNYFEEFKKLSNQYELNNWEMTRVPHLSQRSYAKSKEFISGKSILPTKGIGQEFSQHMKKNASMIQLSPLGQSIIEKFVQDNMTKENKMRQIEQRVLEYQHTKRPLQLNPWKNSFHIIKEFSLPPLDKLHSFKIVNKTRSFNKLK